MQLTHPAPDCWQWERNLGIGSVCAAFQLLVLFPYVFVNFFPSLNVDGFLILKRTYFLLLQIES